MSVTFPVSAVTKACEPQKYVAIDPFTSFHDVIKIRPEAAGANLPVLLPNTIQRTITEGGKTHTWEQEIGMHGFLRAVHESYALHYPLVLSPDDVWLTIAQGFATHVNVNAKKLRKQFVSFEGKVYIEIRRDSFVKGSPDNDWQGGFAEFSDRIAEYIGKKRDLLVSNFTTTGIVEKAASELVLMDAMKQYFDYGCRTMCGIPEITLLGETKDWESVLTRAQNLAEFGCTEWVASLTHVLKLFVKASKGSANPKDWENLYKLDGGSGGPFVTGFVNVFFPYLARECPNRYALGWDTKTWKEQRGFMDGPNTGDFPKGVSSVPFKWIYYYQEFPMQFVGGFVGTHQDPVTLALRPSIGWGIADRINQPEAK